MLYADTSFLVSCYIRDGNTVRAKAAINVVTQPFAFTDLHRLEIGNALQLAVFRKRLTPDEATAAWSDLARDVRAKLLVRAWPRWSEALRAAARFAAKHSAVMGTRSFDILHVSAAKKMDVRDFYTFDGRQSLLARAAGLNVLP